MKLNHLNLSVTDVVATRQFLETYFGLRPHQEVKTNPGFDMLRDDNGLVLTLIKSPRTTELQYPSTFHIGFIQESEEHVNAIYERLRNDGYEVNAPQRLHGSWTFYFLCPGGFLIEVLA